MDCLRVFSLKEYKVVFNLVMYSLPLCFHYRNAQQGSIWKCTEWLSNATTWDLPTRSIWCHSQLLADKCTFTAIFWLSQYISSWLWNLRKNIKVIYSHHRIVIISNKVHHNMGQCNIFGSLFSIQIAHCHHTSGGGTFLLLKCQAGCVCFDISLH